jgi:hypothetical protein
MGQLPPPLVAGEKENFVCDAGLTTVADASDGEVVVRLKD